METKDQIRLFYKNKIKDQKNISSKQEEDLIRNISSFLNNKNSLTIAAYKALSDEISIEELYSSSPHQFVFPRIEKDEMEFCKGDSFVKNQLSFLEPSEKSQKISLDCIDVFLIPGRAFDRKGGRLGRGKSYYDRSLSLSKGLKVGISFDCQIHPSSLPQEEHDVLMDVIITPSFVLIPRGFNDQFKSIFKRTA